jgi:D-3-phosphoglycerate dehydrogenase
MRVTITTTSFGKYDSSSLDRLKEERIAYRLNPYGRKLTREEIVELAKGADGIIAGTEVLDDWVLRRLPELKVISRCGVGMDNIDLEVAERLDTRVFNTPYGPTLAVAELTVGLILDLLRKVTLMDRDLREGIWQKQMGSLLHGKKIGIIGFGRIGQKVAELLLPFRLEIAYCDVCDVSCKLACTAKDLSELLGWADIISLHLSCPEENEPIIGRREIQQMKRGSWLINVARGGVVDEEALYEGLSRGHLSGAALDVFQDEPYNGPFITLNNVVLTPHIGSYAKEARAEMERQAVENLIAGLGV